MVNSRNVLTPPILDDLEEALLGSANEVALIRGCSLGLLILASHSVPVASSNGYPATS